MADGRVGLGCVGGRPWGSLAAARWAVAGLVGTTGRKTKLRVDVLEVHRVRTLRPRSPPLVVYLALAG